ncbi:YciI family protein [Rhodococcus sp. NPDC058505]|uniref:YciI family protein n=1 Tax=unclassified Rhodococcus (in: high G+C Gram-positive bacteria) TaxID=192944 RepID=UPI003655EDC3
MRYMLIMRATDEAIAASKDIPFEQIIEDMGRYNESMMKAGVLLGGEGLTEAEEGCVVDFSSDPPLVTDGPYGETKELFNGYWILDVASREEAVEWARRAPLGAGSKLEIRRVHGPEDFPQDNEWVQKEEGWREELETRNG